MSGNAKMSPRALASLALAAALAAAGVVTGTAPPAAGGRASAAIARTWFAGSGTIYYLKANALATATHFFNTATGYGLGSNTAASPVPYGWATTPVLAYGSYAAFANDVSTGAITYPYKWVSYDPEKTAATPLAEQQDPIRYMRLFGQLAHAHAMRAVMVPALSLAYVAGSAYPRQLNESASHWYTRVNIAGRTAATTDVLILQNESNQYNVSLYRSFYNTTRTQARAANPAIAVNTEVSTANGTVSQMVAAARSVTPAGYYVSAPDPAGGLAFFRAMQAAGY